ncbi:MAG: ROK family protein, partial [Okeania sp. SIO4D6]|nr:ROK family protein [Okeania sp. SIO4D6]
MNEVKTIQTLAVDIGGSGIKVIVLDETGEPITKRSRVETPDPAKPDPMLKEIVSLAVEQGEFDRISVGFPGVVMDGVIKTAANLDSDWIGLNLAAMLSERLGKPV